MSESMSQLVDKVKRKRMKFMSEYNEKMVLRYIMLKNLILASDWKWHHQLNTVSVYQLILIFLMTKIQCHMTTAAVHR